MHRRKQVVHLAGGIRKVVPTVAGGAAPPPSSQPAAPAPAISPLIAAAQAAAQRLAAQVREQHILPFFACEISRAMCVRRHCTTCWARVIGQPAMHCTCICNGRRCMPSLAATTQQPSDSFLLASLIPCLRTDALLLRRRA